MSCKITTNLFYCPAYSTGGIKRMFITPRNEINTFYFSTGDTQFSTITSFLTQEAYNDLNGITSEEEFDGWFEFTIHPQGCFYTESKVQGKNRAQFNQILDLQFIEYDSDKRNRLTELVNSRFLILFLDKNNKWYCFGDSTLGAKLQDYSFTTGVDSEVNSIRLVMQNQSKHPIRLVSTSWIEQNVLPTAPELVPCNCINLIDYPLSYSLSCELSDLLTCDLS